MFCKLINKHSVFSTLLASILSAFSIISKIVPSAERVVSYLSKDGYKFEHRRRARTQTKRTRNENDILKELVPSSRGKVIVTNSQPKDYLWPVHPSGSETNQDFYISTLQGLALVTAQQAAVDCNGKSFYCTSPTEFVHCIETTPGVFSADSASSACPAGTICDNNVAFECSGIVAPSEQQVMPG